VFESTSTAAAALARVRPSSSEEELQGGGEGVWPGVEDVEWEDVLVDADADADVAKGKGKGKEGGGEEEEEEEEEEDAGKEANDVGVSGLGKSRTRACGTIIPTPPPPPPPPTGCMESPSPPTSEFPFGTAALLRDPVLLPNVGPIAAAGGLSPAGPRPAPLGPVGPTGLIRGGGGGAFAPVAILAAAILAIIIDGCIPIPGGIGMAIPGCKGIVILGGNGMPGGQDGMPPGKGKQGNMSGAGGLPPDTPLRPPFAPPSPSPFAALLSLLPFRPLPLLLRGLPGGIGGMGGIGRKGGIRRKLYFEPALLAFFRFRPADAIVLDQGRNQSRTRRIICFSMVFLDPLKGGTTAGVALSSATRALRLVLPH
jgi:hypothetical protein